MSIPTLCTRCSQHVAFTPDWTLWPWPDGAWLCDTCNDERHESEEYDAPPEPNATGNKWLAGKLHQQTSPNQPEQSPSAPGRNYFSLYRDRRRTPKR
jgi:hypothetical protein